MIERRQTERRRDILLLISYQFIKKPPNIVSRINAGEDPPFGAHVKPAAKHADFGPFKKIPTEWYFYGALDFKPL
jgi:hypothetical protein